MIHDDSWKDSYDEWKLRSPYDEECWHEPEECDHAGHESDILSGEAWCHRCRRSWTMTAEETDAEIRHQAEYYEHQRTEARREFWRKLTLPIRWPIYRLLERIWPRKACSVLTDDEIPF